MHRRLYNAAQRDQDGKAELLAWLKEHGKERITQMDMGTTMEWLLYLNDREVAPDAPARLTAVSS
jgi:hypothetical protein